MARHYQRQGGGARTTTTITTTGRKKEQAAAAAATTTTSETTLLRRGAAIVRAQLMLFPPPDDPPQHQHSIAEPRLHRRQQQQHRQHSAVVVVDDDAPPPSPLSATFPLQRDPTNLSDFSDPFAPQRLARSENGVEVVTVAAAAATGTAPPPRSSVVQQRRRLRPGISSSLQRIPPKDSTESNGSRLLLLSSLLQQREQGSSSQRRPRSESTNRSRPHQRPTSPPPPARRNSSSPITGRSGEWSVSAASEIMTVSNDNNNKPPDLSDNDEQDLFDRYVAHEVYSFHQAQEDEGEGVELYHRSNSSTNRNNNNSRSHHPADNSRSKPPPKQWYYDPPPPPPCASEPPAFCGDVVVPPQVEHDEFNNDDDDLYRALFLHNNNNVDDDVRSFDGGEGVTHEEYNNNHCHHQDVYQQHPAADTVNTSYTYLDDEAGEILVISPDGNCCDQHRPNDVASDNANEPPPQSVLHHESLGGDCTTTASSSFAGSSGSESSSLSQQQSKQQQQQKLYNRSVRKKDPPMSNKTLRQLTEEIQQHYGTGHTDDDGEDNYNPRNKTMQSGQQQQYTIDKEPRQQSRSFSPLAETTSANQGPQQQDHKSHLRHPQPPSQQYQHRLIPEPPTAMASPQRMIGLTMANNNVSPRKAVSSAVADSSSSSYLFPRQQHSPKSYSQHHGNSSRSSHQQATLRSNDSNAYRTLLRNGAYQHARSAGFVWQSLVGQHLKMPTSWWNGQRGPPLGNLNYAAEPRPWMYSSRDTVPKNPFLLQLVRGRASAGRILLHVIVQDIFTSTTLQDICVGCFHPNARGVRESEVALQQWEDCRDVWVAVRKHSDHVSAVEALLLNLSYPKCRSPLGPGARVNNTNVRAVFGDQPPLETIRLPEDELSERVAYRMTRDSVPASLALLHEFVFA